MKILSFETSAKAASVALMEDGKLLGECYQNTGLTHSQTIMRMAENVLSECGVAVSDLDAVAVAHGPGSFTGVRIGAAAAKGLSWGTEKPLYGVSTLEGMALSFGAYEGTVCAVMDARRSQVYNALFTAHCGKLTRACEDRAISMAELGENLQNCPQPIFLVGDGAKLCYNSLLESVPGLVLPPEHRQHQRAVGIGLAAFRMAAKGEAPDGKELTLNYLRLSQAERERAAREAEKEK